MFIVRGRSIDGTVWWDGNGWTNDCDSAVVLDHDAAVAVINQRRERNKQVDPDFIIGHLDMIEVTEGDIEPERAANVEDGDDMGEGYEDERTDPRDEPESPGYYFDEDGAHKY